VLFYVGPNLGQEPLVHWLPVATRIDFNIILQVFNVQGAWLQDNWKNSLSKGFFPKRKQHTLAMVYRHYIPRMRKPCKTVISALCCFVATAFTRTQNVMSIIDIA
jgi:hypothetical protein